MLMDEPAFPGCVLICRPIGVIEGEQGDKKDKERNDRIVAIEQDAHSWEDIKTIDDLGKQFVQGTGRVLCELPQAFRERISRARP